MMKPGNDRIFSRRNIRRRGCFSDAGYPARLLGCMMAVLLAGGCGDEKIERYTAEIPKPLKPAARGVEKRLLAAIIPAEGQTWFFKLMGEAAVVTAEKEAFDAFVKSVKFDGGQIDWIVPDAWEKEPSAGITFAKFRVGSAKTTEQVTVTSLGGAGGSLVANINRWRRQIGLAAISPAELPQFTKEVEIGKLKATLVDMDGVGGRTKSTPPFANSFPPQKQQRAGKLEYDVPDGWKPSPKQGGFRVAAFLAESDQVEITVIPLAGGGSPLANINRWREQIGLAPVSADEVAKEQNTVKVAGQTGIYVDLANPDEKGSARILAVMFPHNRQTWFVKMTGPSQLVDRQKTAFEQFVASVQFSGD